MFDHFGCVAATCPASLVLFRTKFFGREWHLATIYVTTNEAIGYGRDA